MGSARRRRASAVDSPAEIWREYLRERKDRTSDVRGLLAAWLADEYQLGRADEGWAELRAAYARGELSPPRVDPLWPTGQRYLAVLRRFLVRTGYAGGSVRATR